MENSLRQRRHPRRKTMKKLITLALASLVGVSAHADMIVDMNLELKCTVPQRSLFENEAVNVKADKKGTTVTAFGKTYRGPVMGGGTEGGPFYVQYFDNPNGVRIDFFGGD